MTTNKPPKYMNIPEGLHDYFLSKGWLSDYWMELPMNWMDWPDKQLKLFPITKVIYDWKMLNK
jgi:hypothetical protein